MRRRREPEVYAISGVRPGLKDDQDTRVRKYMLSMSLRMACFIGALVVEGPMRWVLLAGSLVLPWVAVVIANAGRESGSAGDFKYQGGRELH